MAVLTKSEDGLRDDEPLLDTRVLPHVRIINGALDEDPDDPNGIVLNGRIGLETLRFLKIDEEYQRPLGERPKLFMALKDGVVVPNVDLGVRGQDFVTEDTGDYIIRSPVYVIDGWQRVGTALKVLDLYPQQPLRIFATLHFGTERVWERHRFTDLNTDVRKVSPNLHLRNMRDKNDAMLTLYGLSNNTPSFPLYERVQWNQNRQRHELLSALTLARTSIFLHGHLVPLPRRSGEETAAALQSLVRITSLNAFRENVTRFFQLIDECFGLRAIEYIRNAPHVKDQFLAQLARVFSDHIDFWDQSDRVFFVAADLRHKLAKFPVSDPHVIGLAGGVGPAHRMLYELIVNHINSGKRTGRLQQRESRK